MTLIHWCPLSVEAQVCNFHIQYILGARSKDFIKYLATFGFRFVACRYLLPIGHLASRIPSTYDRLSQFPNFVFERGLGSWILPFHLCFFLIDSVKVFSG
jgi:hypothetical protein